MSSLCPSALASLDDSVARFCASLEELKAAKSVDIAEVIEQFERAAESARNLGTLVSSEMPEASWQNRAELDALLEQIQRSFEAKALEQLRSRLLALANELERGRIVHRRALRVDRLNQLREQATNELRSQAELQGTPQTLPGPEADRWIAWACGLKEPQDAEPLQTLRNGFAHLDDFVANLEPNMWIAAGSPTLEIPPEAERSADQTPSVSSEVLALADALPLPLAEPSPPVEAPYFPWIDSILEQVELEVAKSSGGRDEPRLPDLLDELSLPEPKPNTFTPNDVTPPPTEGEIQRDLARERALLASMMDLDGGSVSINVERPFIVEAFRETSAAPAITSDFRIGVEEPSRGKWRMLLATAAGAVLVLAALGAIQWSSLRNHTSKGPVEASERKIESSRTQAKPPSPLLHRQPVEGAQDKILLTMELCERVNPLSIECWGYVLNLRDESSDVSLYRADVIDGKGNSFNLSGNGQFDFSTSHSVNIPAGSSVKYTIKIPDKDQDAQKLTLYLDVNSPRDMEYTFRDVPVADLTEAPS